MSSTQDSTTDVSAVQAVIDALAKATREKNVDAAVALYAPGNVMMALASPLRIVATDEASGKQRLKSWFDTWDGPLTWEHRDFAIAASGDVAFAHGLTRMAGARTSGERADLWFRETLGFRRIGGAWKIAHQHQSVPFKMDGSNQAELTLRP